MARKGRLLEILVYCLQNAANTETIEIRSPELFFDEDGDFIGEVDVTLRGTLGSRKVLFGIECRDRPGGSPQGRAWIRELLGKKIDLGLTGMAAVSSTGFTKTAIKLAVKNRILLIVRGKGEWIHPQYLNQLAYEIRLPNWKCDEVEIILEHDDDEILVRAEEALSASGFSQPFLLPENNEEPITIKEFVSRDAEKLISATKVTDNTLHKLEYELDLNAKINKFNIRVKRLAVDILVWQETYVGIPEQLCFVLVPDTQLIGIAYVNEFEVQSRKLLLIFTILPEKIRQLNGSRQVELSGAILDENGAPFFDRPRSISIELPGLLDTQPPSFNIDRLFQAATIDEIKP